MSICCASRSALSKSSKFPHTWASPTHRDRNDILINNINREALKHVYVWSYSICSVLNRNMSDTTTAVSSCNYRLWFEQQWSYSWLNSRPHRLHLTATTTLGDLRQLSQGLMPSLHYMTCSPSFTFIIHTPHRHWISSHPLLMTPQAVAASGYISSGLNILMNWPQLQPIRQQDTEWGIQLKKSKQGKSLCIKDNTCCSRTLIQSSTKCYFFHISEQTTVYRLFLWDVNLPVESFGVKLGEGCWFYTSHISLFWHFVNVFWLD